MADPKVYIMCLEQELKQSDAERLLAITHAQHLEKALIDVRYELDTKLKEAVFQNEQLQSKLNITKIELSDKIRHYDEKVRAWKEQCAMRDKAKTKLFECNFVLSETKDAHEVTKKMLADTARELEHVREQKQLLEQTNLELITSMKHLTTALMRTTSNDI